MHRFSVRFASSIPVAMAMTLLLATGCADRIGLGEVDGGPGTGKAGTGSTTGSAGTGSTTGGAGTGSTTGGAGTGSTTGSAGVTGSAGTNGTGKAGTTGAAGVVGTAGTGGKAGSGGKAGTGGTICPPVCDIYCPFGNVVDAKGCATCSCNPAPACKPEECGLMSGTGAGAALPAPICNGKPLPQSCTRDAMTGKCFLTSVCGCPTVACPPIYCPNGNKIDPTTGCGTCECNPAPTACSTDECGALPPVDYSMKCADGTILKPTCGRNPGGMCFWTFPKCPPVVCPAIACLKACPYGSRPDANGCATCDCLEPKACGTITDWKTCTADMRCTWLQPGCSSPALAAGGCYSRDDVGCMTDSDCSGARTCLKRVINPCYSPGGGASCDACGQVQTVCL